MLLTLIKNLLPQAERRQRKHAEEKLREAEAQLENLQGMAEVQRKDAEEKLQEFEAWLEDVQGTAEVRVKEAGAGHALISTCTPVPELHSIL